jgi:hypothetical protein
MDRVLVTASNANNAENVVKMNVTDLVVDPVAVPVPSRASNFVFAFGVYKGDDLLVEEDDKKTYNLSLELSQHFSGVLIDSPNPFLSVA